MDRWKAEQGRGREKRKIRREKSRRERVYKKKEDGDARKGRKVAIHCVFPMIFGSGGSKSTFAKAAGAEPAGQRRDEKVHAVVARSTFPSQNVQSTPRSDHFWKLRCRKSARRCGAKHISKSKCTKHTILGPLLEVEMSQKCTPLWREAHFQVKMYKTHQLRTTFGSWDVEKVHVAVARSTFPSQNVKNTRASDHFWTFRFRFAWQAQGIVHRVKSEQNVRVLVAFQKNDGRRGTFEEDLQRCIRLAGAVQETCSSEMLGGQGADFLRGVAFWSIRYVDFLRWFCVTGAAFRMTWHLFLVAGAAFDRWSGKIAKRIGARPSALHSTFHVFRKSRRIALFLMLSNSKIEEVSQNCFVLDVVKFKKWRSLAELLPFLCSQLRKNEEVSQNTLVFKLADRQVDRQTDRQTDGQTER